MKCPKCNSDTFKKVKNSDGTHYYRCSTCHYETEVIRIFSRILGFLFIIIINNIF
jgi:transcription elongation factor Elf1